MVSGNWVSVGIEAAAAAASIITLVVLTRIARIVLAAPHKLADHRYRELIENAPDAILQVDEQGKIIIVNHTTERLFGYSREELIGNTVELLVPLAHRAAHAKHREDFRQSGRPLSMDSRIGNLFGRRKDGSEFPAEIGLSPVKTETGTYVTAMIRDVTDRKRLESQLQREQALRGQRIEVLARLAADLAHEIKNPLAIIHGRASDLAELIEQGETLAPDSVLKTCESIVKTTERAIRVIRGVEALAHEGSRDPMRPTNLRRLVEQAVELMKTRYTTHGIALDAVFQSNLPMIECREVQIEQILVNLLNNAFDAIDGAAHSQPWVQVRVSLPPGAADTVQIDVSDGGPGVSPENRDHLMETFFTTKPTGSGIGIGLSVSRTIAEEHCGTLELLDAAGPTCFRLILPIRSVRSEGDPHDD